MGLSDPTLAIPTGFTVMEGFDQELQRFESSIASLEGRLNPILESRGPDTGATPEEAPMHDLHNMVLRLRRLNSYLDETISRIHL